MRPLRAEERALWRRVTADVTPLVAQMADEPLPPVAKPARPTAVPLAQPPRAGHRKPGATLDGGWDRRLGKGAVEPDRVIDFHGHRLDTAHALLGRALDEAVAEGARVLLLVTGRPPSPGSGRGAIRGAIGDWLAASPHAGSIAAIRNAHPRHGGAGALYLILRRKR